MACYEPDSQTVSLILDAATANAAIHAISVSAADREARTREIQHIAQGLPEDSYGRRNRETIAASKRRWLRVSPSADGQRCVTFRRLR